MKNAVRAAEKFISRDETIAGVEEYGQGIIHDTYLVSLNSGSKQFILQCINSLVFKDPAALMHNLIYVSQHISKRITEKDSGISAEWQVVHRIPTVDGRDYFIDPAGNFWRALNFIQGAGPLEKIASLDQAREVGRALGIFHWLVSDLNPEQLQESLPGFHNIEQYLEHYDEVIGRMHETGRRDIFCRSFIEDRRNWAPVLEQARRDNELTVRIIHGDPKINNIMVDSDTGKAVSIIDLDTLMGGLVQYDIGDCLRSCCNTAGEDAADYGMVRFDLKRCQAVLQGYNATAQGFLSARDYDFFFDAVRLIAFELGLRFYTDFLAGNVYFKVKSEYQNLGRARMQFKLVESIEQQEEEIRKIIEECRVSAG